jgi:hypothetical protein
MPQLRLRDRPGRRIRHQRRRLPELPLTPFCALLAGLWVTVDDGRSSQLHVLGAASGQQQPQSTSFDPDERAIDLQRSAQPGDGYGLPAVRTALAREALRAPVDTLR